MPSLVLDEDALEELTRGVRELFPVKTESLQPSSREVEGLYYAREPPQDDKRRSLIFTARYIKNGTLCIYNKAELCNEPVWRRRHS